MEIVFAIFIFLMMLFAIIIVTQQIQIKKDLKIIKGDTEYIMGLQEDFDAKIDAANAALDSIAEAITAEAQQIADFIAHNPNVNTAALDGVVARLGNVSASVGTIFEPTP